MCDALTHVSSQTNTSIVIKMPTPNILPMVFAVLQLLHRRSNFVVIRVDHARASSSDLLRLSTPPPRFR